MAKLYASFSSKKIAWTRPDLNRQPTGYEPIALAD